MSVYETVNVLAEISSTRSTAKRLTVTSWNNQPAKLDLRIWRNEAGETLPGRGVTLTIDEAKALEAALHNYLATLA